MSVQLLALRGSCRKKFLAVAAIAMFVALAVGQAQAQRVYKIATEGTYPPWSFANPQGGVQGFEVDVAHESCRRLALNCELIVQDFPGFIPGLNAGKFDVVISALSVTEERKKVVDFTRPYARIAMAFAVPKSSPLAKLPGAGQRYHLDDQPEAAQKAIDALKPLLQGKVIGAQAASISQKFIDKYLKSTVSKVNEYKSTQDLDIDLSNGRTDVIAGTLVALTKSLSTSSLRDYTLSGPTFVGGVLGLGYGAAFRKSDPELRASFDRVLADMIKDGTIRRISEKWIGTDVTP